MRRQRKDGTEETNEVVYTHTVQDMASFGAVKIVMESVHCGTSRTRCKVLSNEKRPRMDASELAIAICRSEKAMSKDTTSLTILRIALYDVPELFHGTTELQGRRSAPLSIVIDLA